MRDLHIDIETYSSVDLAKCGVQRYVESEDFEILLIAYAFDEEPVEIVDLKRGERIPHDLMAKLSSGRARFHAWNANFEITCLSTIAPQNPANWHDTMIHAATLGLPRSLADVGKALKLPEDEAKMTEGKELVKFFCTPCKPTEKNGQRTRNLPEHDREKWRMFKEYCKRDVETERTIRRRLEGFPVSEEEHAIWVLDQHINRRGARVDLPLVEEAIRINKEVNARLKEEYTAITGIENPKSVPQLKKWLGHEGSLDKKVVAEMLKTETGDRLRALQLRKQIGKSSIAKYEAAKRYCAKDGRAHGMFQFYGASRTGRWAGRGVQLQNLPQNHIDDLEEARELLMRGDKEALELLYGDVPDTMSQLIRTMFIPKDGYTFAVADFAAIEARVIAWLADEEWRQEVFRKGGDIYCASASQMFHVPVEKHGINGHLRQKGKVAELALGYGGSSGALINMGALKMGLTEEELPEIVRLWRKASPRIELLWNKVNDAVIRAVRYREGTELAHGLSIWNTGKLMHIELPSGRALRYFNTQMTTNRFGGQSFKYQNYDAGKWSWAESYGAKVVENIVQGIARDCLRDSMLAVSQVYPDIVMHIHDEMVVEVPKETAETALKEISAIMARPVPWAEGLLLRGDGYLCEFYRKD